MVSLVSNELSNIITSFVRVKNQIAYYKSRCTNLLKRFTVDQNHSISHLQIIILLIELHFYNKHFDHDIYCHFSSLLHT